MTHYTHKLFCRGVQQLHTLTWIAVEPLKLDMSRLSRGQIASFRGKEKEKTCNTVRLHTKKRQKKQWEIKNRQWDRKTLRGQEERLWWRESNNMEMPLVNIFQWTSCQAASKTCRRQRHEKLQCQSGSNAIMFKSGPTVGWQRLDKNYSAKRVFL